MVNAQILLRLERLHLIINSETVDAFYNRDRLNFAYFALHEPAMQFGSDSSCLHVKFNAYQFESASKFGHPLDPNTQKTSNHY